MATPRDSTREQLVSAFGGSKLGAVLVGQAGVGKTALARAVAKDITSKRPRITSHWVSGTASARLVPFGAFSHLVEVADAGEPATLLRTARESLCREAPGGLLLAVDDAHHLDTLSATLVHQLAVTESARLLLTARAGEPAPDAITALWKDDILARVDIQPFSRDETAKMLERVLGGPVETVSADKVFTVSDGNLLYLRHLVEGALSSGALRRVEGVWQLRGEMILTPSIRHVVRLGLPKMLP